MSEIAISVRNLSKVYRLYRKPLHRFLDMYGMLPGAARKYSEHAAVNELSFQIARGEKVGIIGRNGAGKSTLLKMICGVVSPTSGGLEVSGQVHALLSLGTGFHPDFTGRENIYSYLAHLGITGAEADRKFADIVEFSELHEYIEQPVKTYSAGMGVRLMFSTATVFAPDILVIDEVLGAGDAYFSNKSFERMQELCQSDGTTLLMVTHDLYSAVNFCDRLIWIDKGRIRMDGAGRTVLRAYEDSIRDQEEQRLRSRRLAAMQANLQRAAGGQTELVPAYLKPVDDGKAPDIAISHLRFLDDGVEIARVAVDDASSSIDLVLDSKEGNWGELETIQGRPARRMRPHGSIFHKLPFVIADPAIVGAVEEGRLNVEIGCLAGRDCVLDLIVLDAEGAPRFGGQLVVTPSGWQDIATKVRPANPIQEANGSAPVARHGQRDMEVVDVQFLDGSDSECMQFTMGAALKVRLSYRLNRPDFNERPTIVVAFQQNGVVRSHRFWSDKILLSAAESREGTMEIVANPLLLGAGTYLVTVSIFQEGYFSSPGPKKFFTANDQLYDMHARAYEIVVLPSQTVPLCNDVIFQHPSTWLLNGAPVTESVPHVERPATARQPVASAGD